MLSRVASHLYWMSRYLERAENMARILDVTQSLAMLDRSADSGGAMTPIVITEAQAEFAATHLPATYENVVAFLAWDRQHPSSIRNCIESTRENARAVRGSITSEMWENINDTWIAFQEKSRSINPLMTGNEFFEWVKERSHLFRGITFATARRDQPYHFVRLGTFIERADNTARILNVKYADEAPDTFEETEVDKETDYYRLSAVLRSVSALEAYRDTYRDVIDARRVAEIMIFDPKLPRSLRYCMDEATAVIDSLPTESSRIPRRIVAEINAKLRYGTIDEVLDYGLKRYLADFLMDMVKLGGSVNAAYMETR
ncbi:MAG: alpha-E domain-containing protein [Burkholderiales bacterium]|nr:alpha-E domain-containing protein [Burkholderiales bacterium]